VRVDFEAYIEAAIVFVRAAVHRTQSRYRRHRDWKAWWDSILSNNAVQFFRRERDWILKEASPRIGQILFAGTANASESRYETKLAEEFYYFEDPSTSATITVEKHLAELELLLTEAESRFRGGRQRDDGDAAISKD
jgi:DNA-directed RNA polymerase specialized sigma24 family protein